MCRETSALQSPKSQSETRASDCGLPRYPVCFDCPQDQRPHQPSLGSSDTRGLKAPGTSHQASFASCTFHGRVKGLLFSVTTNLTSEKMTHSLQHPQSLQYRENREKSARQTEFSGVWRLVLYFKSTSTNVNVCPPGTRTCHTHAHLCAHIHVKTPEEEVGGGRREGHKGADMVKHGF